MSVLKYINHYRHTFRSSITYKILSCKTKNLQLSDEKVMIFAPHPDDEILGCGGLLNMLTACDINVHIVIMTKGEKVASMSHADASTTSLLRLELASRAQAICIGKEKSKSHFLNYPDGGIKYEHRATNDVKDLIQDVKPTTIFVSSKLDLFPDHVNASKIIQQICIGTSIKVYEYLTWFWLFHKYKENKNIPFENIYSLKLSKEAIIRKKKALGIYFDSKDEFGHYISGEIPKVMLTFLLKGEEFFIKVKK